MKTPRSKTPEAPRKTNRNKSNGKSALTPSQFNFQPRTVEPLKSSASATNPGDLREHEIAVVNAKIDVGFGNQLYIRGQGAGLSWEKGVPLVCLDQNTWFWATQTSEEIVFKLLLNDCVWTKGEDLKVAPGMQLETQPVF